MTGSRSRLARCWRRLGHASLFVEVSYLSLFGRHGLEAKGCALAVVVPAGPGLLRHVVLVALAPSPRRTASIDLARIPAGHEETAHVVGRPRGLSNSQQLFLGVAGGSKLLQGWWLCRGRGGVDDGRGLDGVVRGRRRVRGLVEGSRRGAAQGQSTVSRTAIAAAPAAKSVS